MRKQLNAALFFSILNHFQIIKIIVNRMFLLFRSTRLSSTMGNIYKYQLKLSILYIKKCPNRMNAGCQEAERIYKNILKEEKWRNIFQ